MSDQNYNSWENPGPGTYRPPHRPANNMATASLVCAIIALITACTLYGALVFGGLAIIFGLLSRGEEKRLPRTGNIGLKIGILSLVVSGVIFGLSFFYIFHEFGSLENFLRKYEYTMEQYGIDMDLDDLLKNYNGGQSTPDTESNPADLIQQYQETERL